MSKDRIEEFTEDEEYQAWYEEQVALGQEASDEEYLKWYLETKQTKSRPHASKELPSKIGTRKGALYRDKGKGKKERAKKIKSHHVATLARQSELLLDNAGKVDEDSIVDRFGYGKFDVETRKKQLVANAEAVENRMNSNKKQKKWDAQKERRREVYYKRVVAEEEAYAALVNETWGAYPDEFVSRDEREKHDAEVEAKAAAQAKFEEDCAKLYSGKTTAKNGKSK